MLYDYYVLYLIQMIVKLVYIGIVSVLRYK